MNNYFNSLTEIFGTDCQNVKKLEDSIVLIEDSKFVASIIKKSIFSFVFHYLQPKYTNCPIEDLQKIYQIELNNILNDHLNEKELFDFELKNLTKLVESMAVKYYSGDKDQLESLESLVEISRKCGIEKNYFIAKLNEEKKIIEERRISSNITLDSIYRMVDAYEEILLSREEVNLLLEKPENTEENKLIEEKSEEKSDEKHIKKKKKSSVEVVKAELMEEKLVPKINYEEV